MRLTSVKRKDQNKKSTVKISFNWCSGVAVYGCSKDYSECARKPDVLCSNYPANVLSSVERVEVVERKLSGNLLLPQLSCYLQMFVTENTDTKKKIMKLL